MSAGKGVRHSEHNLGDAPLRFIQMWFIPAAQGLNPNYGSYCGDAEVCKPNAMLEIDLHRTEKHHRRVRLYKPQHSYMCTYECLLRVHAQLL